MKSFLLTLLTLILLAGVGSFGCGTKADGKVDIRPLEKAFRTAAPAARENVAQAVAAIKALDYAGSSSLLMKLQQVESLTADQRQVVQSTLRQLNLLIPPKPMKPGVPMTLPKR